MGEDHRCQENADRPVRRLGAEARCRSRLRRQRLLFYCP
jgi:hypothetical protein